MENGESVIKKAGRGRLEVAETPYYPCDKFVYYSTTLKKVKISLKY